MLSQSGLSSYVVSGIVDGDVTTYGWATDASGYGAWLMINFGLVGRPVTGIAVHGGNPSNALYDVQYSDDATNWTTVATGFNPAGGMWCTVTWSNVGAHRFWRLFLTNTPGPGGWNHELAVIVAPEFTLRGGDSTLTTAMLSQSGLSSYIPAGIIDGDPSSNGWDTDGSVANNAWLQLDLGVPGRPVTGFAVYGGNPGNAIYDVRYSDDSTSWTTVATGFQPTSAWRTASWGNVGTHRYWRLVLTNTPGVGGWSHELAITVAPTPVTDQLLSVCEASCFAASTSFSTVPYYTMDTPRSATLSYTEERAHPRPIVIADVSGVGPSATNWPTQYYLEATFNGANVTFLNGDTRLYFAGSAQTERLAGQFDASSYSTGVYPLTVTVTGVFAGGAIVQRSYTQNVVIVNEAQSPIGKGWTVAGVQRLYFPTGGGYLITDGTGSAVYFPALNRPALDFSVLSSSAGTYTRTYTDGTQVAFAASGLATSVTDRLGNTTTFGYDGSSRLQTITEPLRNRQGAGSSAPYLTFAYGSRGLASITETGGIGTGRATTVTVATDSTITAIKDPDGDSTSYSYDANKRLATVTDRRGGVTTYVYNSSTWKLQQVQLPQVAVNAGSGTTTNVNPKTSYVPWQTQGIPTAHTSSGAPATPGPADVLASVTDPVGRVTQFRADRLGQPTSIIAPSGLTTTISRLGLLPYQITRSSIGTDTIAYYAGTPLVQRMRSVGDSAVNYHYGAKNQVDSIWGPGLSLEQRFLHATTGRTDSIQYNHESQTMVRLSYDSWNRVLTYKDAGLHITQYHYNSVFGSTDSLTQPGNLYSLRRFDRFGRDSVTWSSGAVAWTRVLYDSLNRVRKTWHAGLTNDTTTIVYDDLFPIRMITPGGLLNKVEFNALGWVTREYDTGDTTRYLSFRYDSAGRLTSWTNRRSQRVDLTYDVQDRLLTKTRGGLTDTYTYSTTGNWQTAWRPNVSRDSLYFRSNGVMDSLVRKVAGHRYVMQYQDTAYTGGRLEYNKISSDLAISFVQRAHRAIYVGSAGYVIMRDTLTGPTESAVNRPQVQYNPDGLPVAIQWSLNDWGLPPSYVFQGFTALHQRYQDTVNTNVGSTARSDSLSRRYAYDSLGNLVFEHRKSGTGSIRRRFTYDPWGRLKVVYKSSGSLCTATLDTILGSQFASCPATTISDSADYDAFGNRRKPGDAYGPGNRVLTWPGTTGTVTYTYDLDGNIATRTHGGVTDSLFWSATNELDSVRSGGTRLVYEYNSMGQLVRRQRNGVYDRFFLWDQTHLLAELNASGTRIAQYMYYDGVDRPFAMATDSGTKTIVRYYFQDVQGNVLGLMRNEKLVRYTPYTPWGLSDSSAGTTLTALKDTNRIAWKGLLYEGDSTKLYFMRNRWYDPQAGRFTSEDPLGIAGGSNLYLFANNDPINGLDPSGTCGYTKTHYDPYTGNISSEHLSVLPGMWIPDSDHGVLWCNCDDVTFVDNPPICPEHNLLPSPPPGGTIGAQSEPAPSIFKTDACSKARFDVGVSGLLDMADLKLVTNAAKYARAGLWSMRAARVLALGQHRVIQAYIGISGAAAFAHDATSVSGVVGAAQASLPLMDEMEVLPFLKKFPIAGTVLEAAKMAHECFGEK